MLLEPRPGPEEEEAGQSRVALFKRAYSFAVTCLGMKEKEAVDYALKSVDKLLDELEKKKKVE